VTRGPSTSRGEREGRLLNGLVYLGLVAWVLSLVTSCPFVLVFLGLLAGVLFLSGVGLAWLTLWAECKDSRLGQFGIASLFFLAVFVAAFFGTVRWIVTRIPASMGAPPDTAGVFITVTVICLVTAASLVPVVLGMTEALLWSAVWLLKQPPVRHWLVTQRKTRLHKGGRQEGR